MESIIVLTNGADEQRVSALVAGLSASSDIALVGMAQEIQSIEGVAQFVSDTSLSEAFQAAVASKDTETFLLVDAASSVSVETIQVASEAEHSSLYAIGLFSFSSADEEVSALDLDTSSIISLFSPGRALPLPVLRIRRSFVRELGLIDTQVNAAFAASTIVAALAENELIDTELAQLEVTNEVIQANGFSLSTESAAQILRLAINSVNIEELFPNRPWEHDQSENAAACYNVLAARFIQLGDMNSANDALSLSEQLEETPRSMALRGILAMLQGEALEAVANMVSSLQEYERYKKEVLHSVIQVNPSSESLETINSALQSGLEALNKRDNEEAAGKFAEALFLFDDFYKECGLQIQS